MSKWGLLLGVLMVGMPVSTVAQETGTQGIVDVGGYFDSEFIANATTSNFNAHRLVVDAAGLLHRNLYFETRLRLEYGALVNSGTDDGQIQIEKAWLDVFMSNWATLRLGVMAVPFGILNLHHDPENLETTDRGVFATYIVPTTWSDTGAGIHSTFDLENGWTLGYETAVLNGLRTLSPTALDRVRLAKAGFRTDNNTAKAWVGRVNLTVPDGEVGVSGYTGKTNDNQTQQLNMVGLDAQWKTGVVEWIGEWAQATVTGGDGFTGNYGGYYLEAQYPFFPAFLKSTFLGESYRDPVLTAVIRYSVADMDFAVIDANDLTQWTAGLSYRPVQTVVFRMENQWTRTVSTGLVASQFSASVAVRF